MTEKHLQDFLESKVLQYNKPEFITHDPICVPHLFSKKQDIEIAGFFASIFAWGNRTTIIAKAKELMQRMDNTPHEFCKNHTASDLKNIIGFRHRTFTDTDILYFIDFLKHHYSSHNSLETAFTQGVQNTDDTIESGLNFFYRYVFSLEYVPRRTHKHISAPLKKSACKRINMFLRWMVRNDNAGVDFGIWKNIKPTQLVIPLDLHVARVAKKFILISSLSSNWATALELTQKLKQMDDNDPCKFDFALFTLGVVEKF